MFAIMENSHVSISTFKLSPPNQPAEEKVTLDSMYGMLQSYFVWTSISIMSCNLKWWKMALNAYCISSSETIALP